MTKFEIATAAQNTNNAVKLALAEQSDTMAQLAMKLNIAEQQLQLAQSAAPIATSPGVVNLSDPVTNSLIGILIAVIAVLYNIFTRKIKKNEEDLKFLEEKLCLASVNKTYCDGKQELWDTRFQQMLKQHERDHDQILEIMIKESKASAARAADFAEQIKELAECVKNLELGKEC